MSSLTWRKLHQRRPAGGENSRYPMPMVRGAGNAATKLAAGVAVGCAATRLVVTVATCRTTNEEEPTDAASSTAENPRAAHLEKNPERPRKRLRCLNLFSLSARSHQNLLL